MVVAVDHVAHRSWSDFFDLLQVDSGGLSVQRIRGDNAVRRHDEHRLGAAVTEDVNIVCELAGLVLGLLLGG